MIGGYGDPTRLAAAVEQFEANYGPLFPGSDPVSGTLGGGETMISPTGQAVIAPTTASAEQLSPEDLHYAETSSAGQLATGMDTPPLGLESGLPDIPIMDGRPTSEADRTAYRPAASSKTEIRPKSSAEALGLMPSAQVTSDPFYKSVSF